MHNRRILLTWRRAITAAVIAAAATCPPAFAGVPTFPPSARQAGAVAQAATDATAVADIVKAKGEVFVRRGAAEAWEKAGPGDVLKPEDSIRLAAGAVAAVRTGLKTIDLPGPAIVDVADLRDLTRDDLLLKLAMEDVRSVPLPATKLGNPEVARTTTTRGSNRDTGNAGPVGTAGTGTDNGLRLAGAKVLYDNGFYGTCVLRSREIFRLEPALGADVPARLRVADALEKTGLPDEAYDAYAQLAAGQLGAEERRIVNDRMEKLGGQK